MRINIDVMLHKYNVTPGRIVDWCFANLTPYSWGVKSVAGIGCVWFSDPTDLERFIEHWG